MLKYMRGENRKFMNHENQLIKNTFIIALGKLGTQIVSFLLLPLYTEKLVPSEMGIYDFLITLCNFIQPIITLLMEESMFRFFKEKEKGSLCSFSSEKKPRSSNRNKGNRCFVLPQSTS